MDRMDDNFSSAHPKRVPVIISMKLHGMRQLLGLRLDSDG